MNNQRRGGSSTRYNQSKRFLLLVFILVAGIVFCLRYQRKKSTSENWSAARSWLKKYKLDKWAPDLKNEGIDSLEELGNLFSMKDIGSDFRFKRLNVKLQKLIIALQMKMAFALMLQSHNLGYVESKLQKVGKNSFESLRSISESEIQDLFADHAGLSDYVQMKTVIQNLDSLHSDSIAGLLVHISGENTSYAWRLLFYTLLVLLCTVVYKKACAAVGNISLEELFSGNQSYCNVITGHAPCLYKTQVDWLWDIPGTVGKMFSFNIRFYQVTGREFVLRDVKKINVEIKLDGVSASAHSFEQDMTKENTAKVSFPVHASGRYIISVKYDGKSVNGSPFIQHMLPGPMKPEKTTVVGQTTISVATVNIPHQICVEPRDEYDNCCQATNFDESAFSLTIKDIRSQYCFSENTVFDFDKTSKRILVKFTLRKEGSYSICMKYADTVLINGESTVLVLSEKEMTQVNKNVNSRRHDTYYEAHLLAVRKDDKQKKVYCYTSPRQLAIKEYFMKIFPKRVVTFRVNPYTKFEFLGCHNQYKKDMMSVRDSCQGPVFLVSHHCRLIAATFAAHVNKNIGGSETFSEKRDFFYSELQIYHRKRSRSKIHLRINRFKLMESSMKATRDFSTSDWCKKFEVNFTGEAGLDYGGLGREWFELVCTELFETSGLFTRLSDDAQSLYHPNPTRRMYLTKLKYYEFAGRVVGKCMYESALGGSYRQLVKARFTRSFLAQLIGLRVNYKYFEQDDPELYKSKFKYIAENSVEDMELTFTEEVYENGQLKKVVDLIDNGSQILVTDANKLKYLQALAQFRLETNVKDEVAAFLKGFNDLIPDSLLSMFDELELELLMCGTSDFSVEDLRKHHTLTWGVTSSSQTLQRFWTIISGFTKDEMARLLQFITGCSQLPPGGFSELKPLVTISCASERNKLPTAHTCFNQLCLPQYDSIEDMHKALLTAITEGCQGFLLV